MRENKPPPGRISKSDGAVLSVALDARALNTPHLRGMGKYAWNIVDRLSRDDRVHWILFGDRPEIPFHAPDTAFADIRQFELRGYRLHSWEQLGLPWHTARVKVDVLHCPATRVPWWQPAPTVVTIHDVMPWLGDEPSWPRGWYRDSLIPYAWRRTHAIITDSDNSKTDIVRIFPNLENKLRVIPLGVDDAYLTVPPGPVPAALRDAGVHTPYLLYIGGPIERKRAGWAIKVFECLADPALRLVLCGFDCTAADEFLRSISPVLRARLQFLPFVAEADMPRLLQDAIAILYPTRYEGFGLPIVEAHAVGTPVLFSPVSSLTELIGPAAEVLPVDDLNAWVDTVQRLVAQRRECPAPHQASRQWARQFSWDVCAARHLEVYRAVAKR